jgi:hypothetical protein
MIAMPLSAESGTTDYGLLISPWAARLGTTVRALAVSDAPLDSARIVVQGPSGTIRVVNTRNGGGPPHWWSAEFRVEAPGAYVIMLSRKREVLIRQEVKTESRETLKTGEKAAGQPEGVWNRTTENLYAAWVESLFSGSDERASWKALHEVVRDPRHNVLYDHLGLGEDDPQSRSAVIMEPDCADAPYFLRAYFAWKMRLPFGYRQCTRGSLGQAPRCPDWTSTAFKPGAKDEVRSFNRFLEEVKNTIHSGTARTALEDEASDYYPVALTRESLRPGVVFADPYGHTLILVRWQDQTKDAPGQLLAADAQPDGTIGLRRFWRGNFLFETKGIVGNPGFKAFRPVSRDGGRLRPWTNEEILRSPDYGGYSLQQKNMAAQSFYDIMQRLINPEPLDPVTALRDLATAFQEQLLTRVISVANAEEYMKAHPGTVVPMPSSAAGVFQNLGQWEDYSTPNRDMRLLIAMDVLLGFPEEIVRSPQSYILPKGDAASVKQKLEELLRRWARETTITYTKSDEKPQVLTVEQIIERGPALELAYNPNDCVEIRWGAPEGSAERAACGRRAPAWQRQRMETLRPWFHRRLRPPT